MLTQIVKVGGMTCQNCVSHVQEALLEVAHVRAVSVDFDAGTATIDAESEISREALISALQAAGYALK